MLLGGRYVRRKDAETGPDGSPNFYENAHKFTPTAAILWKPVANVTAYLSYAQSLQPGGAAGPDTQNAGQHFPVIASRQYEAGAKAQLGGLLATAAVFRIEQGFEYDRPVAGQLPIHVQDGIERHDGFEVALSGKVAVAALSVTGILIWMRKRPARLSGRARRRAADTVRTEPCVHAHSCSPIATEADAASSSGRPLSALDYMASPRVRIVRTCGTGPAATRSAGIARPETEFRIRRLPWPMTRDCHASPLT